MQPRLKFITGLKKSKLETNVSKLQQLPRELTANSVSNEGCLLVETLDATLLTPPEPTPSHGDANSLAPRHAKRRSLLTEAVSDPTIYSVPKTLRNNRFKGHDKVIFALDQPCDEAGFVLHELPGIHLRANKSLESPLASHRYLGFPQKQDTSTIGTALGSPSGPGHGFLARRRDLSRQRRGCSRDHPRGEITARSCHRGPRLSCYTRCLVASCSLPCLQPRHPTQSCSALARDP